MDNFVTNIHIFRLINSHHNLVFDALFRFIRYFGTGWVLIPVLLFAFAYRRSKVKPLVIAVVAETIIVHVLKHFVVQARPAAAISGVHLLQRLHHGSFPSGDTAIAFAIAFTLMRGEKAIVRAAYCFYAVLIAYERVYLGVHFPLDVTAGALIGIMCSYLPYIRRVERRKMKVE